MKSTFARRISILLVLAMVLAMLPVAAMAADETITVYFENNWNWSEVCCYAFNDTDGTNNGTWPGVAMTDTGKTNANGQTIYSAEVSTSMEAIIFSGLKDDGSGYRDQSPNITDYQTGVCYYMTWADGNQVGTYEYDPNAEETEAPVVTETITIYVDAAALNYTTVPNCHYWGGSAASSWPGTAMTLVSGNVYSIEIPADTTGLLFNTAGDADKTGDLAGFADGMIFNGTEFVDYATYTPAGDVVVYDYYLAGTFNGWNVKGNGMTATDGIYSATVAVVAGAHQFKITNGTWTGAVGLDGNTAADAANITFEAAVDGDVTVTYNPADNTYTITGSCLGEAPEIVIESVNVKGTIPGLDWDAAAATGAMSLVDGLYTLTIDNVPASVVGGSAYAFKVVVNNTFDISFPASDWTFYMSAEGSVTITYNPETDEVTLTGENVTYDAPVDPDVPVDPVGEYYVTGSPELTGGAGWLANEFLMVAGENGTYTYTFTALAAGSYALKVTDGTWANNWTAAEGSEYLAADGNLAFTVTAACDVVVTFDGTSVSVAGDNVTAKAPEALTIDKVVIAGGVAGDGTADPGNMFNGLIWAVGEEITVNKMYDNEDGVYTITFSQVLAGTYEFKFVVNDSWSLTYATGLEVTSGVEETAWFAPLGNSTVVVTEDGSTVTFVLDLSGVVYTGDNAKMTVTVEAPASIKENVAPEQIVIGDNEFAFATGNREPVTAPYTATYTGMLYIHPTAMSVIDNWSGTLMEVPSENINMQFGWSYGIVVDGVTVYGNSIEVVEGQTYQIGIMDNMGSGCMVTLTVCSGHNFVDNTCSVCGYVCSNHNWDEGTCLTCGEVCTHETWDANGCTNCYMQCEHEWTYTYTKNVSHVFTCSGACGAELTVEDTAGKQFKFNTAAPALSVDIVMNIAATVPAGFQFSYITVEFNGVTSYYDATLNESTGRYEFAFPGINPQTMGDTFVATVYAYVEGYEVSATLEYSMLKYINSQLKKSSTSAALRTALSDLVMYGEANQVYEDYKTDALLSTLLDSTATLTPSTFPGLDDTYNQQATSGTKDANIDLKGVSMILGSKVIVRMTTFCADASAYSVKVNIGELEYIYAVSDLELAEGYTDRYVVAFDQLKATQFGDVITFSFLDADGNQVGRTLTYSVYTYVQKNQANSDANLVALLEALYNYGEAVKNI